MAISFSQNIAPHNAISTVGLDTASGLQGHYRNQAVHQLSHHSLHLHPQSFAALVGSQMKMMQRQSNLKDLVDRMRQRPKLISSAQSSFEALIGETPPHDPELNRALKFLTVLDELQYGEQGGSDDYESAILAALAGLQSDEHKRRVLSLARGYFDGREDADLAFLNQLNMLADRFDQAAEPVDTSPAASEAATLETDPAAVRTQFRRQLREAGDLGILFSDLTKLGIENKLLEEIGRDLSALDGGNDREYVRSLTLELSRLWQLRSTHDEVGDIAVLMGSHLGRRAAALDVIELTTSLLSFCSKVTVNQNNARQLLAPVQQARLQGQVVFVNCLMDLHARLPDGLWLSAKDRLVQYSALRVLCDRLVEAEERAFAEAAHASG